MSWREKVRPASKKTAIFGCFAGAGRILSRCRMSKGALGEFCIACGIDAWLSDGKQCDKSLDWRPPRALRGVAGLRDGAPSEARGADGERAGRPRGGRRSGGAVGSVDYRNDKFADVGLSASRRTEIWRGAAAAGNLVGYGQHRQYKRGARI